MDSKHNKLFAEAESLFNDDKSGCARRLRAEVAGQVQAQTLSRFGFVRKPDGLVDLSVIAKARICTVLMIATASTALSLSENEFFRELIDVTSGGAHGVKNKSKFKMSRRLTTRVLNVVKKMCKHRVRAKLARWKTISISLDGWKSRHFGKYLAVTGHGSSGGGCKEVVTLGFIALPGPLPATRIATHALRMVNDVTTDDTLLMSATSDGENTEVAAGELIAGPGNGVTCVTHTVQLVVQSGMESDDFKGSIERIRALVAHVRLSGVTMDLMKKARFSRTARVMT